LHEKSRIINVILMDDPIDKSLFRNNKYVKNWKFYKSGLIVDTVLTGKYRVYDKYVIRDH
jgi:hypothetical protein